MRLSPRTARQQAHCCHESLSGSCCIYNFLCLHADWTVLGRRAPNVQGACPAPTGPYPAVPLSLWLTAPPTFPGEGGKQREAKQLDLTRFRSRAVEDTL
jgi:hypothetical protein